MSEIFNDVMVWKKLVEKRVKIVRVLQSTAVNDTMRKISVQTWLNKHLLKPISEWENTICEEVAVLSWKNKTEFSFLPSPKQARIITVSWNDMENIFFCTIVAIYIFILFLFNP